MITKESELLEAIGSASHLVLYGAGKYGRIIYKRLCKYGIRVCAFAVSDLKNNPKEIDGVPVVCVEDLVDWRNEITFVITVQGSTKAITEKILSLNLCNVAAVNNWMLGNDMSFHDQKEEMETYFASCGSCYHIITNTNWIEQWHILLEINEVREEHTYWRLPVLLGWPFCKEFDRMIQGHLVRQQFEQNYGTYVKLPYSGECIRDMGDIKIYMARFHGDQLVNDIEIESYLIPIQVGASLTDKTICELKDNVGTQVSDKNPFFSECTALYWIWKNSQYQEYVGLCHYRRQFVLNQASVAYIREMDVDIVVTIPTMISPNMETFFAGRFISKGCFTIFLEAIQTVARNYYDTTQIYRKQMFYFPCNMFIMKREIMNEFCEFTFGVLDEVEAIYEKRNIVCLKENRYAGYLVENLLSIFVMHNHDRFKVAYTDMKFLK